GGGVAGNDDVRRCCRSPLFLSPAINSRSYAERNRTPCTATFVPVRNRSQEGIHFKGVGATNTTHYRRARGYISVAEPQRGNAHLRMHGHTGCTCYRKESGLRV